VAYVKSAEEISSRAAYIRNGPTLFPARFALGPLGSFNRGIQPSFEQGKLKQLIMAGSHRITTTITSLGNSCQADVKYELMPGRDHYELRDSSGGPVNLSSLSADRVSCTVSKGDAVGPPPTADAASAAKDNGRAKR